MTKNIYIYKTYCATDNNSLSCTELIDGNSLEKQLEYFGTPGYQSGKKLDP